MTLTLDCPRSAETEARAFFAVLTSATPEVSTAPPPVGATRDPAAMIAVAALVMAVPSVVLSTLQLKECREIKSALSALKATLEHSGKTARLTLPSGTSIDFARTSNDAAMDLIIKDLGGR